MTPHAAPTRPIKKSPAPLRPGNLNPLALAVASGLTLLASQPAMAQSATISTNQTASYTWNSGDLIITSTGSVATYPLTAIKTVNSSVGTLTNNGSISGPGGIANFSGTMDLVRNNGIIVATSGYGAGVAAFNGTIGAVINNNSISGATAGQRQAGIVSGTSYIGTIVNSGTISNIDFGISDVASSTVGTLVNSGSISGLVNAINVDSTSTMGAIANTGTISGSILNQSPSGLVISGGSGAAFGTLTGLGGAIGNIASASGLTFSGGNQLLNDNVAAGTVNNAAGVLQVNNQIAITGNYQQNATAALRIGVSDAAVANGVAADTGYGRLMVSGDAVVSAGSTIQLKALNSYAFATGQKFVVIQAAGSGTQYNQSALNYVIPGYSGIGTAVADGGGYDLLVTVTDPITGSGRVVNPATNRNAYAVLQGLFAYNGVNQNLLNVFNPAAALSDPAAANRAGAQLSPMATNVAAINGVNAAVGAVQNAVVGRIDTLRTAQSGSASGVATGESTLAPALWGRAFGGAARQTERDGISGYHAGYGGLMLGGDALVQPDWRAGGLFSYGRVSVGNDGDNTGSSAAVNSYGLTAYAGYDGKPWYLNLMTGLSRQQYRTTRAIGFTGFSGVADGRFNGMQYGAAVQAGYPLGMDGWSPGTTLTPIAGLNYSTLRQNGYTETGGNGAALAVNASSSNSLTSELGARLERIVSTSWGKLTPSLQLSWRHEYRDSRVQSGASFAADSAGSTAFITQGAKPVADVGILNVGVTLMKSKQLSLTARYTLESGGGYTAQTGSMQVRWQY